MQEGGRNTLPMEMNNRSRRQFRMQQKIWWARQRQQRMENMMELNLWPQEHSSVLRPVSCHTFSQAQLGEQAVQVLLGSPRSVTYLHCPRSAEMSAHYCASQILHCSSLWSCLNYSYSDSSKYQLAIYHLQNPFPYSGTVLQDLINRSQ